MLKNEERIAEVKRRIAKKEQQQAAIQTAETICLRRILCCCSFFAIRRFTSAIRSSFFSICTTLPFQ